MEKTTPEQLRMIADAISARNEALSERDAYRAILTGVHGALMDAENIPVPDIGDPLDKAVRALVAERDTLQAWKGFSAAAYSLRTEQMQAALRRAEQAEAAITEMEAIVISGDDPAALREVIDKSRLPIVAQSSVLLQPAPLDAPDAPVKPDWTIRRILPTSLEWYDILFDEDELPPHARTNPDGTIRGVK